MNIKSNKDIKATIRFSSPEHKHIQYLAKQSQLSLSDYIRRRLFDEDFPQNFEQPQEVTSINKFACDHERELMKLTMRMFLLIKAISKGALSEEAYKECNEQAKKVLKEWNYE